jgi:hypothetical protein
VFNLAADPKWIGKVLENPTIRVSNSEIENSGFTKEKQSIEC